MAANQPNFDDFMAARRRRLLRFSRLARLRRPAPEGGNDPEGQSSSLGSSDAERVAVEGARSRTADVHTATDVSADIQALVSRLQADYESVVCICWGKTQK